MDTSFRITEEENQYLRWRSKAQREGFLHKLGLAYYSNSLENIYSVSVEGDSRLIPVFVDGDWFQRVSADVPITSYSNDKYSNFDMEYIRKIAKSVAYESGDVEGDIKDYLWNNPTYGVIHGSTDALEFGLRLTDYYSVKTLSARLTEEAFESAYEHGLRAGASQEQVEEEISELDLSFRDRYYQNFDQMASFDVPRLCARSTIVVMNTGEEYVVPFERRSGSVSESPFWWNPIPGSVFQPLQESASPSMEEDTIHAVSEKLVQGQDPRRVRSYVSDCIDEGSATLEYTTTGIDFINGYVQFYNMLLIDDVEFYDRFITEGQNSWHSKDTALINIKNKNRMDELLDPTVLNPYNVLGLSEALMRLNEYYGIDVPLHITRRY